MIGMQKDVPGFGAPRTGLVLEYLHALLDDGPVDDALLARLQTPEVAAERIAIATRLRDNDWADLGRYERENAEIVASRQRPEIVFMGDSITEMWGHADPELFGPGRVCRGIAGQTTPQMLLRFQADVIALRPRVLHLMGGGNDIVGNTGPTTLRRVQDHFRAMTDLATCHGIRVILGGLTPSKFSRPDAPQKHWVAELDAWLRELARDRGCTFVDYFAPLRDSEGAMRLEFGNDEVHPNRRGYAVMRAALEPAL